LEIAVPGTTWLLDIDGVVNYSGRPSWPDHREFEPIRPFTIRYSPTLIAEIKRIAADHGVTVLLASTWCGMSETLLTGLDLPIAEAFGDVAHLVPEEQKIAAAHEVLARDGRLIWTDDDCIPADFADDRALTIRPDEATGLTPEHIAQVEAWLTADLPVLAPAADPS
jgi:hypothetical protein